MFKAPSQNLFNSVRKPTKRVVRRDSSPDSHAEPASTAPSPSSATSISRHSFDEDNSTAAELEAAIAPLSLKKPRSRDTDAPLKTKDSPRPRPPIKPKRLSTAEGSTRPALEEPGPDDSLRLVIAIDYGTTFTGVGYATPQSGTEDATNLDQIHVVTDWGMKMTNDIKIPSVISYSPRTSNNELQFGADLSPDAVAMVHTKMELDVQETRLDELDLIVQVLDGMKNLNFEHIKANKGMPEYTWKTPEEVVTDYLKKVFKPFWDATDYLGHIRELITVDVVITVPVDWSYRARSSTLKAVRNAGFNETNFPRLNKYLMVTEPEAAATFTLRHMQQDGLTSLKANQCFILCDAGGGTVDVVGYKVKQLTPSVELEQMTTPTGAKCGSTFINNSFKKWLQSPEVLGEHYRLLDPRDDGSMINAHATETGAMRELMREFEAHKKAFHQDSPEMYIELPSVLHRLTVPGRIDQGELTITNEDMRSFFDDHVDRIIELIQYHILQIEDKNSMVAAVLLIGGFSESEYLQQELLESIEVLRDITLHRPKTSWSAVVQGAVLYGVEVASREHTKVMVPCPRNYGVQLSDSFTKGVHDPRDRVTHALTNEAMARQQLTWLIRKGDLLMAGDGRTVEKPLVASFREGGTRVFNLPIYEYLGDKAPDRFKIAHEEINEVAVLTVNFEGYPLEKFDRKVNHASRITYYEAQLTCRLRITGMNLIGELLWYEEYLSTTEIKDIHLIETA